MLQVCQACTTRYAVDLPACPHCGSTDRIHESQLPEVPPDPTLAADSTPPPSSPGSSEGPPDGDPDPLGMP